MSTTEKRTTPKKSSELPTQLSARELAEVSARAAADNLEKARAAHAEAASLCTAAAALVDAAEKGHAAAVEASASRRDDDALVDAAGRAHTRLAHVRGDHKEAAAASARAALRVSDCEHELAETERRAEIARRIEVLEGHAPFVREQMGEGLKALARFQSCMMAVRERIAVDADLARDTRALGRGPCGECRGTGRAAPRVVSGKHVETPCAACRGLGTSVPGVPLVPDGTIAAGVLARMMLEIGGAMPQSRNPHEFRFPFEVGPEKNDDSGAKMLAAIVSTVAASMAEAARHRRNGVPEATREQLEKVGQIFSKHVDRASAITELETAEQGIADARAAGVRLEHEKRLAIVAQTRAYVAGKAMNEDGSVLEPDGSRSSPQVIARKVAERVAGLFGTAPPPPPPAQPPPPARSRVPSTPGGRSGAPEGAWEVGDDFFDGMPRVG